MPARPGPRPCSGRGGGVAHRAGVLPHLVEESRWPRRRRAGRTVPPRPPAGPPGPPDGAPRRLLLRLRGASASARAPPPDPLAGRVRQGRTVLRFPSAGGSSLRRLGGRRGSREVDAAKRKIQDTSPRRPYRRYIPAPAGSSRPHQDDDKRRDEMPRARRPPPRLALVSFCHCRPSFPVDVYILYLTTSGGEHATEFLQFFPGKS